MEDQEMQDMGEFPPLGPQDITCSGGIRLKLGGGNAPGPDQAGEDDA